MRIDPVHRHTPTHVAPQASKAKSMATIAAGAPAAEEPTSLPNQVDRPGEARGVLRLLDEGHFKGVAELRHRIHHFDELAAEAKASAAEMLPAQLSKLSETVDGKLSALAEQLPLDEQTSNAIAELQSNFGIAIQQISESGSASDIDALRGLTEAAFAKFVEDLSAALGTLSQKEQESIAIPVPLIDESLELTDQPITVTEIEPKAESVPGPAPIAIDDIVSSLTAAFSEALSELTTVYTTAAALPDPAPAPGNGKAFAKFLAIYNQLRDASSSASLDSVA